MKLAIFLFNMVIFSVQAYSNESLSSIDNGTPTPALSPNNSKLSPALSIYQSSVPTNDTIPTVAPTQAPSLSTVPTMAPSSNHSVVPTELPTPAPSVSTAPTMSPSLNHTVIPTELPTPAPSMSTVPTMSPSSNHTVIPTELPTELPTQLPSADLPGKKASTGNIIAKSIGWLIIVALSVLLFGAVMSNRYQLYYALRGVWFTILQMDCTRWIVTKLNFRGLRRRRAGVNGSLNEIIFDENNDLTEGLLMGDT